MGLFEILKGEQPGFIKTLLNYENAGQFGNSQLSTHLQTIISPANLSF